MKKRLGAIRNVFEGVRGVSMSLNRLEIVSKLSQEAIRG